MVWPMERVNGNLHYGESLQGDPLLGASLGCAGYPDLADDHFRILCFGPKTISKNVIENKKINTKIENS